MTTGLILLAAVFVTAAISGTFGMAGGMILMGVLTALLPVSAAMVVHGLLQSVSNGWRAVLLRRDIDWSVVGRYVVGGVPGIALLLWIVWRPDSTHVFLMLGLIAFIPWIPKRFFALDVKRKGQAELLGFIAQTLNTLAGTVGPILDVFFVRTAMTRQEVVATKAVTQLIAHLTKVGFWAGPLLAGSFGYGEGALTVLLLAIPLSMAGTWVGGRILALMSDVGFRQWTKYILTVIGVVYLARGIGVF